MKNKNFTTSFLVDQSPEEVFNSINNVRGWWSGEINGDASKLGSEFTYRVPDVHFSKQRVTEFVKSKKIVWRVSDAVLNFVKDKNEWNDTNIIFKIERIDNKTKVEFIHEGLAANFECYNSCSNAWNLLVNGNLRKLIITGEDQPSPW